MSEMYAKNADERNIKVFSIRWKSLLLITQKQTHADKTVN